MLLFVAVGRFSHDEPISLSGLVQTGWPFAVGLAGGYIAVVFARWPAVTLGGGLLISIKMTVLAVLFRAGVAGDPIPPAFVAVAAVFLLAGTTGWRAVALRRINGAWPSDVHTGIRRRSRLEFLRPSRRTKIFNR